MAGIQDEGTVKPHSPFDPNHDAEVLRKAMKGLGTDEKAIIDVLAYRSNDQRQEITKMFKTMYGRDLISDLKSELGGKFEDVIIGLMMKPADFDAKCLKKAIKGAGTDEDALIEIMCTRNNAQIHAIKASYKTLYKSDLEKDIMGDTGGHFKRLMVSMSTGGRSEAPVNPAKAQADAKALYEAGEAKWGTDESKFNQILAAQSYDQLRLVFQEYSNLSKKTIEQAIKSEMSGDLEKGMLAIAKFVNDKAGYFAEELYKTMKGAGTSDQDLIRIVVSRCEVDMVQIKQSFQAKYGKTLASFIADDCSGDYKKVLLALVR